MATGTATTATLRQLVEANLSLFLYEPAKFFAERLYYEDPQPEHLHLLGQSYFRAGKVQQTYLLLQNSPWPANRYLFAMAALQLGKLSEAERALLPTAGADKGSTTKPGQPDTAVPGGAAGLYLLGQVCRRGQRKEAAVEYFKQSLQLDPAMWGAITELSEMGVAVDTSALFGVDLSAALKVLCDNDVSVAIASTHAAAAWASDTVLHPQAAAAAAVASSSSSSNSSSSGGVGVGSDGQAHLAAVVERRRVAESLADASPLSPRAAICLGLSSASLRVPFATPGRCVYPGPCLSPPACMHALSSPREGGCTQRPVSRPRTRPFSSSPP